MKILFRFIMIAFFLPPLLSGCCLLPLCEIPFVEEESLPQTERAETTAVTTPTATPAPDPVATAVISMPSGKERMVKLRESYIVNEGDLLWSIARRSDIYGDPLLWPLIYQANRDQIKDPRIIYTGQTLVIPRNSSESEREEARNRAKKSGIFPP